MSQKYEEKTLERVIKLQEEYRKNAKLANSRLAALEKRGGGILRFSYAGATHDTQALFGTNRFSYKISAMKPEDVDLKQLSMYNTSAKNFLEDTTSTYKGFSETAQKRADTINKRFGKYGVNVTPEQIQQLFEDEYFKKLADAYGSTTALRMIGKLQKNADDLKDMIEKAQRQHKGYGEELLKIAMEDSPVTRQMITGKEKRVLMNIGKMLINNKPITKATVTNVGKDVLKKVAKTVVKESVGGALSPAEKKIIKKVTELAIKAIIK